MYDIIRSVQKVSSHVIWKIEIFIDGDTRNIVHRTMMPQSPSKQAPWDLTRFSQSLFHCSKHSAKFFVGIAISCPFIFSWILLTVWNLFPIKGDCSFGKSQKSKGAKPGLYGGWIIWVVWNFTKKLHETWYMSGRVVVMKLPVTSCP